MNVQRHSTSGDTSDEVDLDSTAELPVLDIAAIEARANDEPLASTDTWIIPAPTLRLPRDAAADGADAARNDARTELETNLRALSANLGDLEDRLKRKVEQLAENERILLEVRAERAATEQRAEQLTRDLARSRAAEAAARASIAQLERKVEEITESAAAAERAHAAGLERMQREGTQTAQALSEQGRAFTAKLDEQARVLAALRRELTGSQAQAARYFETLQSHEGRRTLLDNLLSGLQSDVDSGESRVSFLEGELAARSTRVRQLESELSQRGQRITALETEVSALADSLEQRDARLLESERATAELRRKVSSLEESLAASQASNQMLQEAVDRQAQSMSSRESDLAKTAHERDRLRTSVTSLEAALSAATNSLGEKEKEAGAAHGRCQELEKQLGGQREQGERLESELRVVRAEMDRMASAMKESTAERSEHVAAVTAREERIKELEARIEEQQDAVRILQAEANASIARTKEVESDLGVAEEAIRRLELELRSKVARLSELEHANREWHTRVDAARSALTEKEALIQRLEEEAANSSVLLGQIQQSMKRLDPSNSGTHEAMPEGATRLLVRVDGGSEIVHVLGRKTSIGRTPDNDLQIDAKFISRHHAVILAGPARTIVEDLNSTNGVIVNGRRITRQVLQDGDNVIVGRTEFRFVVKQPIERH